MKIQDFDLETLNAGVWGEEPIIPTKHFKLSIYDDWDNELVIEGVVDETGNFSGDAVFTDSPASVPIRITADVSEDTSLEYFNREVSYLVFDTFRIRTGDAVFDERVETLVEPLLGSLRLGDRPALGYGGTRLPQY